MPIERRNGRLEYVGLRKYKIPQHDLSKYGLSPRIEERFFGVFAYVFHDSAYAPMTEFYFPNDTSRNA
jgi:hypothetical protein